MGKLPQRMAQGFVHQSCPLSWFLGSGVEALGLDCLQREELEVILFINPSAFKRFDRKPGTGCECQGIELVIMLVVVFYDGQKDEGCQDCHK